MLFLYLQCNLKKKTVRKEIKVAFYIIVILLNILSNICVLKGKDGTYKRFPILLTVIYLTKHIFAVHEHITCDNYLPQWGIKYSRIASRVSNLFRIILIIDQIDILHIYINIK